MEKKLYRSRSNRKICGVCGGIGEYINIDPTVIRLLWIFLGFFWVGIVAYILAVIVVPENMDY